MSAHEQMRQMLDQLMGTGRDGENNRYKVHFTDPKVCKSFLLACCPHDILASTRMDLGECPKIHDLALRADYEAGSKKKDYYYDVDAMEHLQNFINDCDRRTEQAKKRLAETQEELSSEVTQKLNKVHELAEGIGKKLADAEKQGAEGNVDESLKLMKEVEDIGKEKAQAEQDYRNSMPASSYQQQKLRVCEVCSAYLGIHDNDRRLADHFGGKLHLGFITIRDRLDELKKNVTERREKAREQREKDGITERDDREDERMRRKWNEERGSRSPSRGRNKRGDSSERYKKSRSRSPNYRKRSRSGSRSRHSSSRDRDRRGSHGYSGGRGRDKDREYRRDRDRGGRDHRHSKDKERSPSER